RTAAIQDSESLDSCRFALWEEENWNKIDLLFDEFTDDTLDYMDTEDAQDVGRTRDVVNEEKESVEDAVSTEVNTDKEKDSIVSPDEGTVDQTEGRSASPTTPTTTPTMFGDDETIAQIDPKDKGKKKIEEDDESDTESKGFPEAEKKFKQLARDEEMARKV
ncbi:hypothetical protein Tco_0029892, partial [Tanacetum coccineum]